MMNPTTADTAATASSDQSALLEIRLSNNRRLQDSLHSVLLQLQNEEQSIRGSIFGFVQPVASQIPDASDHLTADPFDSLLTDLAPLPNTLFEPLEPLALEMEASADNNNYVAAPISEPLPLPELNHTVLPEYLPSFEETLTDFSFSATQSDGPFSPASSLSSSVVQSPISPVLLSTPTIPSDIPIPVFAAPTESVTYGKVKKESKTKSNSKSNSSACVHNCTVCNKLVRGTKANLARHMLLHSDSKPLSCHLCTKKFRQLANLQSHMKVHAADAPFPCSECTARYQSLSALRRHQREHWTA